MGKRITIAYLNTLQQEAAIKDAEHKSIKGIGGNTTVQNKQVGGLLNSINNVNNTVLNITQQVKKVFDNLPNVQNAIKAKENASKGEEYTERGETSKISALGQIEEDTRKHSRENYPQALSNLLGGLITDKINNNPVNQRFLAEFKTILRSYHKDMYENGSKNLSPEEKDKIIFSTVMKAMSKQIATHKNPDLDGLAILKLLKICGFADEDQQIKGIGHQDSRAGNLNVDVGGINGIKVQNVQTKGLDHSSWKAYKNSLQKVLDKVMAFIDHHRSTLIKGEISHGTSSSTYVMFKLLESMGVIPADKIEQVQNFVRFVDIVDAAGIEVAGKDFDNSHRTILGLQKLILEDYKNINFIFNQFAKTKDSEGKDIPAKTGLEILSDEYLANTQVYIKGVSTPLKVLSDAKEKTNQETLEKICALEDENKILVSPLNKQKFIVDLDGDLKNAPEVCNYVNCGVIKLLRDGRLYIYSPSTMQLDNTTWSQFGDYIRGHILFVDPNKISDWSQFGKILFNDPQNKKMLEDLKAKIDAKNKPKARVLNITRGVVNKYFAEKESMDVNKDILPGQEYEVMINNVDKRGIFVTFGKDQNGVEINWLCHNSTISKQELIELGEKVLKPIKVIVQSVILDPYTGKYKITILPATTTAAIKDIQKTA